MNKDFGKRNVEGFKGLSKTPYKFADKDYAEQVETVKKFIEKVQKRISHEENHLKTYQKDIERSFYVEGWCSGRVSALEDVLDIFIDCVNEDNYYGNSGN